MPVPLKAFHFSPEMDPAEILDYQIRLRDPGAALLEVGENISTYTLVLYPEAVALGLAIKITGAYAPTNDNDTITIWFEVAALEQLNAEWDGTGAELAMELTVVTDSVPSRKRQRTLILTMVQL